MACDLDAYPDPLLLASIGAALAVEGSNPPGSDGLVGGLAGDNDAGLREKKKRKLPPGAGLDDAAAAAAWASVGGADASAGGVTGAGDVVGAGTGAARPSRGSSAHYHLYRRHRLWHTNSAGSLVYGIFTSGIRP